MIVEPQKVTNCLIQKTVKLWIIKMIKYNIIMCCFEKILVNVAAYRISGYVCVVLYAAIFTNILS